MRGIKWFTFACQFLVFNLGYSQERPHLTCNIGPLKKNFGQSRWLVYSCNDSSSLIVVAGTDNPASPFYFSFYMDGSSYRLRGEGTGSKAASDSAYSELRELSTEAIQSLVKETKEIKK